MSLSIHRKICITDLSANFAQKNIKSLAFQIIVYGNFIAYSLHDITRGYQSTLHHMQQVIRNTFIKSISILQVSYSRENCNMIE